MRFFLARGLFKLARFTGALKTGELYKRFLGLKFYGNDEPEIQNIVDAVIEVICEEPYLATLCGRHDLNIVFCEYSLNRVDTQFLYIKADINEIDPDGLYWFVVESLFACEWNSRGIRLNIEMIRRLKLNVDKRVRKWEIENPI